MGKVKDELKDLWNRNRDKIFVGIALKGVDIMWKKMWSFLWAFGKKELINIIRSQQDEIAELVRKNANPEVVAKNVVEWVCSKIEKI